MKKLIKRIAAVNDISTFGKCSLTVAIPTLSSMGYEVCPIVTSYLSAHTGFENPVFVDMTEYSQAVINHLKELEVEFDSVYTGYIPTLTQMEIVKKFIIENKIKNSLIMIDPVLGDDGKLYSYFDNSHIKKMRELCLFSDVITPNYTEACFLANYEYKEIVTQEDVEKIIFKLNGFGITNKIVITSVPFANDEKKIVVSEYGEVEYIDCEYIKGDYCGAGDAFSSVVLGKMLEGKSILDSSKEAHLFLKKIIKETKKMGGTWEQGIMLEKFLKKWD